MTYLREHRLLLLVLAGVLGVGFVVFAVAARSAQPAEPAPRSQHFVRDVGKPFCQQLTVPVKVRKRTSSWEWGESTEAWIETWSEWSDPVKTVRAASAADCLTLVNKVPAGAVLPDLVLKQLHRCGAGDMEATGGDCFAIIKSAPYIEDFPELAGLKLLKFPVVTLNVGHAPSEIIADRSASDVEEWKAYQTFYDARGRRLGSVQEPSVEFYYAGDEHDHWHIKDFDDYEILDASGQIVRQAEKHGYCLQDNTSYGPMEGLPDVPPEPGVYLETTSCGKGLPASLNIIHGMSRGWGDTYPTTLPDQAIDITDLPDGRYTVRVYVDAYRAVVESNESNNTASMEITIKGNQVTTHPSTSTGGVA